MGDPCRGGPSPGSRGPIFVHTNLPALPTVHAGTETDRLLLLLPLLGPPEDHLFASWCRLTQVGGDQGGLSLPHVPALGGRALSVRTPAPAERASVRAMGRGTAWGLKSPVTAGPPEEEFPDLQEVGHSSSKPSSPGHLPGTLRGPPFGSHMFAVCGLLRILRGTHPPISLAVGGFASEVSHPLLSLAFPCQSRCTHNSDVCDSVSGGSYSKRSLLSTGHPQSRGALSGTKNSPAHF